MLRYDVIGGALDAIHLKMPAAWAAGVALQSLGQRISIDQGDARSRCLLVDHTGTADLGLRAVCAQGQPRALEGSVDRPSGNHASR